MTTSPEIGEHRVATRPEQRPDGSPPGQNVWVDDENAVVRRGMVASLLANHIHVVGESAGMCPPPPLDRVNVLVFDGDSIEALRVMSLAHVAEVRLVATVRQATDTHLRRLADAGAAAILLMAELTPDSLVNAVRTAAANRTTISQCVLTRLLEHAARLSPCGVGQLNPRELHVLQLLADGKETRSIALELNYSERTVKNVVHDLLTKLNSRTRAQAVGVAIRSGIL